MVTRLIILTALLTALACEKSKFTVSAGADKVVYASAESDGYFSGKVVNMQSGDPLPDVDVIIMSKGIISRTTSDAEGKFALDFEKTLRGEAYNIHFQKKGFQNATRAATVELANHRVAMKDVGMRPAGAEAMQ